MRIHKHSGIILIMTMLILLLLSALMLSWMQALALFSKTKTYLLVEYQALSVLERVIVGSLSSSCEIKTKLLLRFEQGGGCIVMIDGVKVRYMWADEGIFRDLSIERGHKKYASHHRTVVATPVQRSRIIIKARLSEITSVVADEHAVDIPEGILSWVLLTS